MVCSRLGEPGCAASALQCTHLASLLQVLRGSLRPAVHLAGPQSSKGSEGAWTSLLQELVLD